MLKFLKILEKSRDITGGLPRVAELFEARKPANPAVMTEINGTVKFGETKRGVRKFMLREKMVRKEHIPFHMVSMSLFMRVILLMLVLIYVKVQYLQMIFYMFLAQRQYRDYLVNEIQEVYRLQGVKINDKHIEIIVNQMMQKVSVKESR